MELEFDGAPARGLRRYVRLVAAASGLSGDSYCVQLDPPANAYLALERRLPGFADRDVALLWDERQGWALAIETTSGEDLVVVSYLGVDVLPAPRTVAEFAEQLLGNEFPGQPEPPNFRASDCDDGLSEQLAAYAAPAYEMPVQARAPRELSTGLRGAG
jgi:hypothetical protein